MSWLNLTSLLGVMAWSATSFATGVVLVKPSNPTPHMTEAMVRINGELASAGFATEVVDESQVKAQVGESQGWLEELAARRGADAVIAMVGDKTPDSVEVWVVDKVTGKSVMRRVPNPTTSKKGPETLAIQAVELLRASFLEIELSSRVGPAKAKPKAPPAVVRWVEHETRPELSRKIGLELGATSVIGLGGVSPAIMPIARLEWNATERFFAQISFAGMGTRPTIDSKIGHAQLSQAFALLGVGSRLGVDPGNFPFLSVAAGAMHSSVEGNATPPFRGVETNQWSFVLDGEFGMRFAIEERLFFNLAAHALLAEPYLVVRFGGKDAATHARPNLLFTLTLGTLL